MRNILKIFFAAKGTRPWAVLICLLLAGIAEGVGVASLLPALSLAFGENDASGPLLSVFTDALAYLGIPMNLLVLVGLASLAILVKNLLNVAAMVYVGFAVAHVSTEMRQRLVENLLNVRWSFFTQQPLGRIANALSVDATRAGSAYLTAATFLTNAIQSVIYVIVALFVSPLLALVAIAVGAGIATLLSSLVRAAKRAGRRQTRHTADFITYLSDGLNNIKPLKAMNRQDNFARLIDKTIRRLRRALRLQVVAKQGLRSLSETLAAVILGFGFVAAIWYWNVSPSELAVLGLVLVRLVNAIGRIQREYQSAAILESAYYNVQRQIRESEAERETGYGDAVPQLERGISLVDVSFSHPRMPVLRDVSIDFPHGAITVLTGPSGAGKTTVIDLVTGFHRPDSGEVLVDDRPLFDYDLGAWRSMIGYVPQELVLFHDTVFANIALGDPEIGEQEVRAALTEAGALDFVEAMPEGMWTEVGEKGGRMSGGQRQRIALARALVKHPRLLILDEVTSALDPETENAIVENILALRGRSTVIAITHRPAFLRIADQVCELSDGRIASLSTGEALAHKAT